MYTLHYHFMNPQVRPQRTKEVGVVFKDVYPVLFPINVSDNPRYFTLFVLIEYLRHVIKSARPPKIVTQIDMDLNRRKSIFESKKGIYLFILRDPIIRINNFRSLVIMSNMFAILLWNKTEDIKCLYSYLQIFSHL